MTRVYVSDTNIWIDFRHAELLTGDGRLRKQAVRDGLEVRGALWLLDRLVDQQLIPPARAAAGLSSMLARGARLPEAECEARMALWKFQAGGSSN